MFLNSLEMVNFGPVVNSKVTFNKGNSPAIAVFSGDNGEGKSTAMSAISLLLVNYVKHNLKDYVNWNATTFFIRAVFEHNDLTFDVSLEYSGESKRILKIHDSSGKIINQATNSDAVKLMSSYFEPKLVKSAAFSFQHDIDLISVTPSERREFLKSIYSLDFKEELESLDKEIRALETSKVTLQAEISALKSLSYELVEIPTLPFSEEDFISLKINQQNLLESIASAKSQNDRITRLKSSVQSDTENLSTQKSLLINNKNSLERNQQQLSSLEATLLEETKKSEEIEFTLTEKFASVKEILSKQIEAKEKELDSVELERPPLFQSSDYDEAVRLLSAAQNNLSNCTETLNRLSAGLCPTCGHLFDAVDLQSAEKDLESAKVVVGEKTLALSELKLKKEKYDKVIEDNNKLLLTKQRIESELSALKLSLTQADQNLNKEIENEKRLAQKSIDSTKSLIEANKQTSAAIQNTVDSISSNIEEIEKSILKNNTELSSLVEIDCSASIEKERSCSESINNFISVKAAIDAKEAQNKATLLVKATNLVTLAEKEKQELETNNKLGELKIAQSVFSKELPSFIISKLVERLMFLMNDFIGKTYGGKYKVELIEQKQALRIVYGPKAADVSISSGYEQQVFSMAWRYARESLLGLGFLVLDEVDSAASDKNSQLLYETLSELPYSQLIVITHRKPTKELLERDYGAQTFTVCDGKIA
jgi:DNA repair exonuclease SbcCD ATPase subunit